MFDWFCYNIPICIGTEGSSHPGGILSAAAQEPYFGADRFSWVGVVETYPWQRQGVALEDLRYDDESAISIPPCGEPGGLVDNLHTHRCWAHAPQWMAKLVGSSQRIIAAMEGPSWNYVWTYHAISVVESMYKSSQMNWIPSPIWHVHQAVPITQHLNCSTPNLTWCSFDVFNCNKRLEISTFLYFTSTFALPAVSSTDKHPRKRSTSLMMWQTFTSSYPLHPDENWDIVSSGCLSKAHEQTLVAVLWR